MRPIGLVTRALVLVVAVFLAGCASDPAVEVDAGVESSTADETASDGSAAPERPTGEVRTIGYRHLGGGAGIGTPRTAILLTTDDLFSAAPMAEIAPDQEVYFLFTLAHSDRCLVSEFQGLEFSDADRRLYPVIDEPEGDGSDCADATAPYGIAVAVLRSDLPKGEFSIWIERSDPARDEQAQATYFASGELTGPDPETVEFPPLTSAGDLAVGETRVAFGTTTHCGLDTLFRNVDGRQWQLADGTATGADYIPSEWQSFVRGEEIDLVITRAETDLLEIAPLGSEDTRPYEPLEGPESGCV